ncbi:MAG TPA: SH3 domain-containing protein [Candidatus Kapabacteria bacterium]|nr:SH3 domain-containing protein [Candidatus Kapabacteria bacterium]
MRYLLLAVTLLLTSCKKEEVEVTTSDSTAVTIERDTLVDRNDGVTPDTTLTSSKDTISAVEEKGDRLLPVDEANTDASFAQYRAQLVRAVEAKSEKDLMPLLDSNISLSFGGSGGYADFKKMWKPQDKNSPLWQKLGWVLSHGGSFSAQGTDKNFWAPYVYSKWPQSGPDAFEYAVATESHVPVYAKPDTTSAVLSTLNYHYVKSLDGGHLREKPPAFVKVQTSSGKIGYVKSSQIRSQIDYRAGFNKINGRWRMTAFIAGD